MNRVKVSGQAASKGLWTLDFGHWISFGSLTRLRRLVPSLLGFVLSLEYYAAGRFEFSWWQAAFKVIDTRFCVGDYFARRASFGLFRGSVLFLFRQPARGYRFFGGLFDDAEAWSFGHQRNRQLEIGTAKLLTANFPGLPGVGQTE